MAPEVPETCLNDDAEPEFRDGVLSSRRYADVYHSRAGAPEESWHVFVQGNNLPERMAAARGGFVVAELGFGTGLNFLQTWRCWQQRASAAAHLYYLAWEASPLPDQLLCQSHASWPQLAELAQQLRACLGPRWPGWHRIEVAPNVTLTVAYEDVAGLAQADFAAQAWYLDGFTPRRNPRMWSDQVMHQVYRLSAPGGSVATYSVAGQVCTALTRAKFVVSRKAGFATKRHMCYAKKPGTATLTPELPENVGIIGAGIAGAAAAHALTRRGVAVRVFDQEESLSDSASANPAIVLTPRASAGAKQRAALINQGFCLTHALCKNRLGAMQHGALLLSTDPREARRQRRLAHWQWPQDMVRAVTASEASEIAGVPLDSGGLWMPLALQLAGADLVRSLLNGIDVRSSSQVARIRRAGDGQWQVIYATGQRFCCSDLLVANGAGTAQLLPGLGGMSSFPGRRFKIGANTVSRKLRSPLLFGGYLGCADQRGSHWCSPGNELGWPAVDWLDLTQAKPCWSAVRTQTDDWMPLAGQIHGSLYVLNGLGSRGFTFGPLLGAQIAAQMLGDPAVLPAHQLELIAPQRMHHKIDWLTG